MSLVNDMLRDLDARRREVPSRGLGAEKLVPATDIANRSRSWRLIATAVLLVVVFAGLISVYVLTSNQQSGQLQLPVIQPTQAVVQDNLPMESQSLMANEDNSLAASDPLVQVSSNSAADVSQLELRLRQLEAQNQALLQAQAQAEAAARAQQLEQQQQLLQQQQALQQQQVPTTSPQQSQRDTVINQEWADAVALPAETAGDETNTSEQQATASSRVARELSFYDRDRQQVQTALQQWASGQQLTALQTLDVFAYENPQAHYSRETLIKLLIQMGETDRAMQAAEIGLAIQPGAASYRKLKARLLLSAAQPMEALGLLSSASPAVSADTEYHDLLASAYLAARQYEGSVMTYRALLQQDSTEARWWYGLAASLDALGRSADAASAYEQALRLPALSESLRQASLQRVQAFRQNAVAN